jgi:hypothetical protein
MAGSSTLTTPFVSALTSGGLKALPKNQGMVPISNAAPNYASLNPAPTPTAQKSPINTAAPAAQQQLQPSGGGGAAVDPYAAWGGAANFNAYMDQYNSGLDNVGQGANEAFGSLNSSLQGNAADILNKFQTGIQGINTARANNELSRQNGIQDIIGYVRNGLKQGYSRLAQGNALDSSAAGALGQLYSQSGANKSRSVNNQSAIQGNTIDQNLNQLNSQRDLDVNSFRRTRDQQVAAIGSSIRAQLAALDNQAAGLNLPGRIDINARKQQLIDQGNAQVAGVDSWLQGQLGGVNPEGQDQILADANKLRLLGTGTPTPFDTGGPIQQTPVSGPAIDQLPIFTSRKRQLA